MSVRCLMKDLSDRLWPLLEKEDDRDEWLDIALADLPELRRDIDWSGNPRQFTQRLVAELLTRQGVKGQQALLNLLNDIVSQKGTEWEAKLKPLHEGVATFQPSSGASANGGLDSVPGETRVSLCQRLGKNWRDLAEYFGIPSHERNRFESGHECHEILEWLENRGYLSKLSHALKFLGRKDLGPLLLDPNEYPAPAGQQTDLQNRSPYPGLHYFTEQDAPLFFGRDKEITELLDLLKPPGKRFIAVIGASGSGKSSLVAAGVIPDVLEKTSWGKHWLPMRFTPGELGNDPFAPLLGQLRPLLEKSRLNTREIGKRLRARGNLGALAEDLLKNEAGEVELLLFIDQFEELFTVVAPEYQPRFVVMLAEAAQASRIRTIVTLRADFFPHCLQHDELKDLLNAGAYSLTAPAPKAQLEMITGPADVAGLQFEGELPWQILDETEREPGALALMAYALSLLWERRQDSKLTRAAYKSFGGVRGAIREQAEGGIRAARRDSQRGAWRRVQGTGGGRSGTPGTRRPDSKARPSRPFPGITGHVSPDPGIY